MSSVASLRMSMLGRCATIRSPARSAPAAGIATVRPYHQTWAPQYPYKDDQDRTSLKPGSTEETKSGTDQDVAQTNVAFDPKKTRPETEKKHAGKEAKGVNPLEASPANQDISKPQGDHGKEG